MRTVLIDNYDSFTQNLFHLIAEVNGREPVVVRNDETERWARITPSRFDNVVISPGPGRPDTERDFGLSRRALEELGLPVLGVCLGHQGLCQLAGATVRHAPEPVHGRLSAVHHDATGLFAGIPSPFDVVRYHSLLAYDLPDSLEPLATTADGLLMAVRHRTLPQWGVQFHPESVLTQHGHRLLANFRDLTGRWHARSAGLAIQGTNTGHAVTARRPEYRTHVRRLEAVPEPEAAFHALFAHESASFWLDSSRVIPGLSRFSFLGATGGPLSQYVTYQVGNREILVRDGGGAVIERRVGESVFDYLEREIAARRTPAPEQLPFEFGLGYVGWLGYELKADCGADAVHAAELPDAAFAFCDRMLAIDHRDGCAWLLALSTAQTRGEAERWLDQTAATLARTQTRVEAPQPAEGALLAVDYRHDLDEYRHLIKECQREIADGESYEICLTNMLAVGEGAGAIDPLHAYSVLRRISPAPYAALLKFPDACVLSSSPERFLSICASGSVESKPIKGTRRRGANPQEDRELVLDLCTAEKDRAENLMIVDLVRNDLGAVAEVGSVHVPKIFDVESYATVHQLVSTIRATLRPGGSPVACVRAAFPGGSMTGAPKKRTMELIDRFEAGPRGVYSGALGYFALSGAVDLSIVIRTVVITPHSVTMGVGGAITALSDPEDEVREMLLKSAAMVRALSLVSEGHRDAAQQGTASG